MKIENKIGFRICDSKGFHITFENGFTVSVQFGPGNYGDNYNGVIGREGSKLAGEEGSREAETAVWGPDGAMIKRSCGDYEDVVQGYQSPAQVLELLTWAAAQTRATAGAPLALPKDAP